MKLLKWLTTLKTLVVKENNMSSKFATPFLAKSPLQGAYTSGADGMVYVSNREAFQKLQDDALQGYANSMADTSKPCDDPNTVSYEDKDGNRKKCPTKKSGSKTFDFTQFDTSDINIDNKSGNKMFELPTFGELYQSQQEQARKQNPYNIGMGYTKPKIF